MFDPVHDIQRAFRKMVRALSFPGTVVDLSMEAEGLEYSCSLPVGLLLAGRVLLDGETRYACTDPELDRLLAMLTFSPRSEPGCAGYVFTDALDARFPALLGSLCTGDLADPHRGATVLARAGFGAPGASWTLRGPGIEHSCTLELELAPGWHEARQECNREFPLGVDMLLFDNNNRMMALPRTTRVVPGGQ